MMTIEKHQIEAIHRQGVEKNFNEIRFLLLQEIKTYPKNFSHSFGQDQKINLTIYSSNESKNSSALNSVDSLAAALKIKLPTLQEDIKIIYNAAIQVLLSHEYIRQVRIDEKNRIFIFELTEKGHGVKNSTELDSLELNQDIPIS